MSDLNNITFTGRLSASAEKKQFQTGTSYALFTVANNVGHGDYAVVNWYKCKLIGKRADSLTQYLTKGKLVGICGTQKKNDWTDKDGNLIRDWVIEVTDISLMAASAAQSGGKQGEMDYGEQEESLDDKLKREAAEVYSKHGKKNISF